MKLEEIVSKDPKVHSGDMVFAQTRIPAAFLVNAIEADVPLSEFLEGYPGITRKRALALLREGLRRIEAEVDLRNKASRSIEQITPAGRAPLRA